MLMGWGGSGCGDAVNGAMPAWAMYCNWGRPWAKKHAQSGLSEHTLLEQSWEESFEDKWREHVDVVLSNTAEVSKENDVEGVAPPSGRPSAIARRRGGPRRP